MPWLTLILHTCAIYINKFQFELAPYLGGFLISIFARSQKICNLFK